LKRYKGSAEISFNEDDRRLLQEINTTVKSFQDQIQALNDELENKKKEKKS